MRIERNYWILDQEKPEYISNLCKPTRLLQCLQMYTWVMIFMIIWISFYPRPSEPLYCSIGQIYPSFAIELEYCVTDAEIHECLKKFSPFIPIALSCLRSNESVRRVTTNWNCMHLFYRGISGLCIEISNTN